MQSSRMTCGTLPAALEQQVATTQKAAATWPRNARPISSDASSLATRCLDLEIPRRERRGLGELCTPSAGHQAKLPVGACELEVLLAQFKDESRLRAAHALEGAQGHTRREWSSRGRWHQEEQHRGLGFAGATSAVLDGCGDAQAALPTAALRRGRLVRPRILPLVVREAVAEGVDHPLGRIDETVSPPRVALRGVGTHVHVLHAEGIRVAPLVEGVCQPACRALDAE
mmetsp:Transcript_9800/g.25367  ORF Transcript_9800/g.25367 Transcript_9800/m.25367 type:complete len:228 (-) Transcript_9800:1906-2589(-)